MRIALMPSASAPAVGGVEVLTSRLAYQLRSRGHDVEVWTARSDNDSLPADEIIEGVRVRRFTFTLPGAALGSLLRFPVRAASTLRALRRAANEFCPDILHVQCFSGNGAYATVLSRLIGTPLVVTLQGETVMDDHDIYDHSVALRTSLRMGLRRAACVTGCSAFVLGDARERFGLEMQKAQVIFNGVDLNETTPVPLALPFDSYVLGLGRVVYKKGFDLLLDAFARVADKYPDVGLVIAGDGAERSRLRQRAFELELGSRVALPGRLTRGEVMAVMNGAQTIVMPSRVEPFGIVALEAWRAGVPVIVSSRGGAPEFVSDGVSGLVDDPTHERAHAAALESLLRSRAFASQLVTEGRSALSRFQWAGLTTSYEDLYTRIAGRG
jgi:glycosyltransferase involved in cell wall biosynthesis